MRTSISHPLEIAEIEAGSGLGKVGLTFCPGKKQKAAMTGAWERDVELDLQAVSEWDAAALVTLVERHELESLAVSHLGEAVGDAHMSWYHLPIRDFDIPGAEFEVAWQACGAELRAILRSGCNVLVHCKGGLGRAGTIAARLLSELGMEPRTAVQAVREVRPGAIQTSAQLSYTLSIAAVSEPQPETSREAIEDRALGAVLGLAVGDALGTTLEFAARDSQPRLRDMIGGGPFRLKAGQWTDDTAMAMALMDSLLAEPKLNETDLMQRFVLWHDAGEYSCTGSCFDIGLTTRAALGRFKQTGDPIAGSTDSHSAGNGSLMRLAPVAVCHWHDPELLRDVAARQSRTTHGAPEAVDACEAFAELLAAAIAGMPRSQILRPRASNFAGAIAPILSGSWRGKRRRDIKSSGYVAHSLEAALWCVARTGTFADAVLMAANLGDDADTTAAITGQLAGALYGAGAIPLPWRDTVAWGEQITASARLLFSRGRES